MIDHDDQIDQFVLCAVRGKSLREIYALIPILSQRDVVDNILLGAGLVRKLGRWLGSWNRDWF